MLNRILILLTAGCCLLAAVCYAQQDQLTVTTYYPSPYGSYRELSAQKMKIGRTYSQAAVADDNLIVEGNIGLGTLTPNSPAPNGARNGNLDVNDVYIRAMDQWISKILYFTQSGFYRNTGGPIEVVFPQPFKAGTTPVVVISRNYTAQDEEMPAACDVKNTGFKISGDATDWTGNNPYGEPRGFYWIAIGER